MSPADKAAIVAALRAHIDTRPMSCSPEGLRPAEDGGATDYAGLDTWGRRECGTCEGTSEGRAGSSCIGCGGKGERDD